MKKRARRIASWLRISEKKTAAEKGAVLILVAASLTVLIGMTAMSVDYGWLYYNQLNTRKAAEAAALAGVVHMPLPDCADPTESTDPYTSAIDVAARNGYTDDVGGNGDAAPRRHMCSTSRRHKAPDRHILLASVRLRHPQRDRVSDGRAATSPQARI